MFDGKTEIFKSFKTKDLRHALRMHKDMDRWYDDVLASNGYGMPLAENLAPRAKVVEVVKDLKNRSLHPTDIPKLDATASPAAFNRFMGSIAEALPLLVEDSQGETKAEETIERFEELRKQGSPFAGLLSYRMEVNRLKEKLQSRYGDIDIIGLMAKPKSRNPKRVWDSSDPDVIKYKIMTGSPDVTPDPTWSNAMHSYLQENLKKVRNNDQKQKHRDAVRSLCQRLSLSLPNGMNTRLADLEPTILRQFAHDTWSNASTRARNLRTYQAIINNWNTYNPEETVINHFTVLVAANKNMVEYDSKVRRSFTPEEYNIFFDNLMACDDPEIKLIGLIMLSYGCPTGEAAGLTRQDIHLKATVPYLMVKNNKHRILGKKRLERAVPIVEPLLTHLTDYIYNHYTGTDRYSLTLLFPRFGEGRHASGDRSKKLKALVENRRPTDEDLLSPYSLRHTFKDKYMAARVPNNIGEYLMGHKSPDSSKVHAQYGTGRGVEDLVADMEAIVNVETWGFFEEYDE